MSNIKYVSKMFPTCSKQVSSVVPLCFQNASKRPSHKHLRFQKSCHRFSAHWYHVIIKNMPPTNQAVSINFKTARFPILSAAPATYLTGHYRPNPLSMVSTHRAYLPYRLKVVESTQWILWIKASIFHHQQDVYSKNIVKIGILQYYFRPNFSQQHLQTVRILQLVCSLVPYQRRAQPLQFTTDCNPAWNISFNVVCIMFQRFQHFHLFHIPETCSLTSGVQINPKKNCWCVHVVQLWFRGV